MSIKRTLLSSLAALFSGVASTWGQNNYATNVVGFYERALPAGQYRAVANQFSTANNTLASLFPNPPVGSQLLKWNGGWNASWFDDIDLVWYPNGSATLNPGEGGLFQSPVATTLTFCGDVCRGTMTNMLPYNTLVMRSCMLPVAGLIQTDLSIPGEPADTVNVYYGGWNTSWFDDIDLIWSPTEPSISLGESFMYNKYGAQDEWVLSYTPDSLPVTGNMRLQIASLGNRQFQLSLANAAAGLSYALMTKDHLNDPLWTLETTLTGTAPVVIEAGTRASAFFRAMRTAQDSDGDGIPDWWTMCYFGHPAGQSSDGSLATSDPDGDGKSNLQEYMGGTNPKLAESLTIFVAEPKLLNVP